MSNSERRIISFEEGWDFMQQGIQKLLEGLPEPNITADDYMTLFTTIYTMCTQKPPHEYSEQLYEKYKETFDGYIKSTVLPSLREKKDELLLRELLERWSNHKIMTKLLSRIFRYLHKYHIRKRGLSSLEETGFLSFYYLVYDEMHRQVMDAILAMVFPVFYFSVIDGNLFGLTCQKTLDYLCQLSNTDQSKTLVNNALTFYSEIGESTRKNDPKHFAETMTKENAAFYTI